MNYLREEYLKINFVINGYGNLDKARKNVSTADIDQSEYDELPASTKATYPTLEAYSQMRYLQRINDLQAYRAKAVQIYNQVNNNSELLDQDEIDGYSTSLTELIGNIDNRIATLQAKVV